MLATQPLGAYGASASSSGTLALLVRSAPSRLTPSGAESSVRPAALKGCVALGAENESLGLWGWPCWLLSRQLRSLIRRRTLAGFATVERRKPSCRAPRSWPATVLACTVTILRSRVREFGIAMLAPPLVVHRAPSAREDVLAACRDNAGSLGHVDCNPVGQDPGRWQASRGHLNSQMS